MRSEEITTMSKNLKDKVRRKHVDWLGELYRLNKVELYDDFFKRWRKLYRGKSLSERRCAYYTLKNYYHTTTIDDLIDKLGVDNVKPIKAVVIGDTEYEL